MSGMKPRTKKPDNLILYYIYLAIACAGVGMGLTVLLILFCQYFGIDLYTNLWLVAVPAVLSVLVNVLFVELYRRIRGK